MSLQVRIYSLTHTHTYIHIHICMYKPYVCWALLSQAKSLSIAWALAKLLLLPLALLYSLLLLPRLRCAPKNTLRHSVCHRLGAHSRTGFSWKWTFRERFGANCDTPILALFFYWGILFKILVWFLNKKKIVFFWNISLRVQCGFWLKKAFSREIISVKII